MTNGSPAVISQSTIMLIRPVTQKAARMLVTIINFSYMVAFLALSEARTVHPRFGTICCFQIDSRLRNVDRAVRLHTFAKSAHLRSRALVGSSSQTIHADSILLPQSSNNSHLEFGPTASPIDVQWRSHMSVQYFGDAPFWPQISAPTHIPNMLFELIQSAVRWLLTLSRH